MVTVAAAAVKSKVLMLLMLAHCLLFLSLCEGVYRLALVLCCSYVCPFYFLCLSAILFKPEGTHIIRTSRKFCHRGSNYDKVFFFCRCFLSRRGEEIFKYL